MHGALILGELVRKANEERARCAPYRLQLDTEATKSPLRRVRTAHAFGRNVIAMVTFGTCAFRVLNASQNFRSNVAQGQADKP